MMIATNKKSPGTANAQALLVQSYVRNSLLRITPAPTVEAESL